MVGPEAALEAEQANLAVLVADRGNWVVRAAGWGNLAALVGLKSEEVPHIWCKPSSL